MMVVVVVVVVVVVWWWYDDGGGGGGCMVVVDCRLSKQIRARSSTIDLQRPRSTLVTSKADKDKYILNHFFLFDLKYILIYFFL